MILFSMCRLLSELRNCSAAPNIGTIPDNSSNRALLVIAAPANYGLRRHILGET